MWGLFKMLFYISSCSIKIVLQEHDNLCFTGTTCMLHIRPKYECHLPPSIGCCLSTPQSHLWIFVCGQSPRILFTKYSLSLYFLWFHKWVRDSGTFLSPPGLYHLLQCPPRSSQSVIKGRFHYCLDLNSIPWVDTFNVL